MPWLLAGLAWAAAGQAAAQTFNSPPQGEFALRHARAGDVKPVLSQVLAALPERVVVEADERSNRLLVRGSHEAQRLAGETIHSLDRPATQTSSQPVLRTYDFHPSELAVAAARMQSDFPADRGTHVSVDRRTSQLLVLADPVTHQRIARQVGSPQPSPHAQPQRLPTANSDETPTKILALRHKTWPQIQSRLERLWGKPLVSIRSPEGGRTSHRLELPSGGVVQVAANETGDQIIVEGQPTLVAAVARLIGALDAQAGPGDTQTRVVSVKHSTPDTVRRAISAFRFGVGDGQAGVAAGAATAAVLNGRRSAIRPLARLFEEPAQPIRVAQAQPDQPPPGVAQEGPQPPGLPAQISGLIGDVEVVYIEALDALILIGPEPDVQLLMQIIADLEQIPQPTIEVYPLEHVGSQALQEVVGPLYDEVLAARQGPVRITALVKPNALLLIGRAESVTAVKTLVDQLDQPVDASTQFEVFRLRHASAVEVQATIENFYEEREALGPRVVATADFNTNAVIVQASPRDLVEIKELIQRIDTSETAAVNNVQIFQLQHTLSTELAPILMQAIYGQSGAQRTTGQQGGGQQQGGFPFPFGGQQNQQAGGQSNQQQGQRSTRLEFMVVDDDVQQRLRSGLLNNVSITAEPRANVLVVSAPPESMDLLAALIRQLDQPPAAVAQVKVFTLRKGDADSLAQLLQDLFSQQAAGGGQGGQPLVVGEGEGTLLPLRFAIDVRTNSIIAAGSDADLAIVEALLFRLDEADIRHRETNVYRLKNAPALDVADAINQFLTTERGVQQAQPAVLTPFEQIEREVTVVPEVVSNSLIISATPRFFQDILDLIKQLDERPEMVLVKVLIAEVALNDTDEFGVELGLQDSVLFDRSLLGDIFTTQTSTAASTDQGVITTTQDVIQAATLTPGFIFNNADPGNAGSTQALAGANHLAGQALSHFSVGRVNGELGYGGLVLSASNESVNILIRALQETRRLDVLSAPEIMTLDNQEARVQVGQRVPRISSATIDETGQVNNVITEDVGLILLVQPRITPDGQVVMAVVAEKSQVGPEIEGIPVSISATGQVIRSPRIDTVRAETVVSVPDRQTIVLGGLFTTRKSQSHRRVPLLSSIPVLGHLFRFDSVAQQRTELLIILTPYVVRNNEDSEMLKQIEASRMSWCLADVHRVYGDIGFQHAAEDWADDGTMVIYPDQNPRGEPVGPPPIDGTMPGGGLQQPMLPGELPADVAPGSQGPLGALPPRFNGAGIQPSPVYHQHPQPPIQPVVYQSPPHAAPGPMYAPAGGPRPPNFGPPPPHAGAGMLPPQGVLRR